ncbi:hypothetical protein K470DRAFT_265578 [Piedraia hortae CBS 480.64]|uniref:F-box domain-containing protein n=1 Tax=Piedraia hortae CBS 480.64 TaxID=1314780 RepID=A0A6A7BV36_9PEZI|nr:hypothetical protein K470DRAFT_265578 [Piedraia hortae CBS 480.64]
MHFDELPPEIWSDILRRAALLNAAEGPHFTYGLSQAQLPLEQPSHQPKPVKYVRGPVSAEQLRWDATASIRQVSSRWHHWALAYNLEHIFERRWQGSERWANLSFNRHSYGLYELIDRPSGSYVYRDPFGSLTLTDTFFQRFPTTAKFVRRLWFNGFYAAKTDGLILSIVANCPCLESLTIPWTVLRRASVDQWLDLLKHNSLRGAPLRSLELQAVCLPSDQAAALYKHTSPSALEDDRVSFASLKRLKFFGNTVHKPVTDRDLYLIAQTATNLDCLDITNLSTVSVAGMLALVKASHDTLQVLEHSPRSDDGFFHPFPGHLENGEHICELLTSLPCMRDLSISIPHVCASLFSEEDVQWAGDLQVRAAGLCGIASSGDGEVRAKALATILSKSRQLIKARQRLRKELHVELFFAGCIFKPEDSLVHGDFTTAEALSHGNWPAAKQNSTLGPYGQTGTYGKEENSWIAVSETEFLRGVVNGWVES